MHREACARARWPAASAIPRPTVYRLLQTLEELGYVERGVSSDLFRVTRKAAGLGDGYDAGVLVAQSLGPILFDLGRRFLWPFDLFVYDNASMIVQETTHARSPLSIDRGMMGRRLPVLRTSPRRTPISPSARRRTRDDPQAYRAARRSRGSAFSRRAFAAAHDRGNPRARVRRARRRRDQSEDVEPSAPILRGDVVLGCLSVIWIRNALPLTRP